MIKTLRAWFSRLGGLFGRDRRDHELADEIESHLQMHVDENLRRGMAPAEARRQALIQLGGVEQTKEAVRQQRGLPFADTLLQDLRFAARQLRKNPGFACTSIVVLAIGICASVSIFAFTDAALIKPLPYADPNRLVEATESIAMFPRANLSYPDYLDWKRLNTVFSSLDVFTGTGYMLRTPTGTDLAMGVRVSDGFFRTLGVTPVLGRDFYQGEDLASAPRTVIISYGAWQRRFGGKADVIGHSITLSGIPYTIVGVLPKNFQFAPRGNADFWATLHPTAGCDLRRGCHSLDGIGRLKDGVSVPAALAEMKSIAGQLERQYPDSNRGQGASVVPLSEAIVGNIRPILLLLLGGAGLLLLIACVNVASLLLARSESRKHEIAVRGALGASAARLIRQFATEGIVLVVASCVLGVALACGAMQALMRLIPAGMLKGMPYLQGLGLNFHVLAFAAAVSLLAAVLFSLTPVARLRLAEMREGLAEGSRGSAGTMWAGFGANLVVVELAIAIVLLAGAGLLGKSLYHLLRVDLGFQSDHLATLQVAVPDASYPKDEQTIALEREIITRTSGLPGVESVGIATQIPLSGNGNTDWIRFVGRPYNGQHNEVNFRVVSSDYFKTLQARLLRGRYFTDGEDESKPNVVIINQALATEYFPGQDPLGQKMGDTELSPKSINEIIGVVDNIREGALDSPMVPAVYCPYNQNPDTDFGIVVRTSQNEQSVIPAVEAIIHQIDPGIGVAGEMTMAERANDSQTAYLHRSAAALVGVFAALALLLGVVGLYGVIAYSVSQRTREIGVRMALGAQQKDVLKMVLRQGLRLAAAGVVLGVVAALAVTRLMSSMLFGVKPGDPLTFLCVAGLLVLVAVAACWIPARRAMRVDPVVSLRYE